MKKHFVRITFVLVFIALIISVGINYKQAKDFHLYKQMTQFENQKLERFALITGKIIGQFTEISIDSLVENHYIMRPYDAEGDGYVVDAGIKHGGIKYYIDSSGIIINWEPH